MSDPNDEKAMAALITMGLKVVNERINALEKETQFLLRAAYQASTASGKSRLAEYAEKQYGSRKKTAEALGVCESRVSQLLNSPKNKKNGK